MVSSWQRLPFPHVQLSDFDFVHGPNFDRTLTLSRKEQLAFCLGLVHPGDIGASTKAFSAPPAD